MSSPHAIRTAAVPLDAKSIREDFARLFGGTGDVRVFRAPGRVNLIGEHTDYNEGFVFPAAVGFATFVAVRPRKDHAIRVHSANYGETRTFSIDFNAPGPEGHWSDYVRGVAGELMRAAVPICGADMFVIGDVPVGSGLSSSAAIEVSTALALLSSADAALDSVTLAKVCQAAEHNYVGTKCGIMDQLISIVGRCGCAMLIDCRNLTWQAAPVSAEVSIVVCNTMIKHELASGEYNRRRSDCEQAVEILRQFGRPMRALRDATLADLEAVRSKMTTAVYRRARHVIEEDERVLEAAAALKTGDLNRFGVLMLESHRSLRDNYEVSCRELDEMVEIAMKVDGVYGARMTGGGFGGCAVALAKNSCVERLVETVRRDYKKITNIDPAVYVCHPEDGAGEIQ
jgi:galactokinase